MTREVSCLMSSDHLDSPLGVQEKLIQAFRPNTSRTAPPSLYKTPPYVTALPEVTIFALAANPAAIAGFTPTQRGAPSATLAGPPAQSDTLTNYTPLSTSNNTALPEGVPTTGSSSRDVGRRFIVLATDGLYDCLSSEEVVALVAGHLDGLKGDKSKKELFEQIGSVKNDPTAAGTASPHKPRSTAENSATKRYCFEDSNICTHLIRCGRT
jgi:pyruvate dehydrogenase phosphatase